MAEIQKVSSATSRKQQKAPATTTNTNFATQQQQQHHQQQNLDGLHNKISTLFFDLDNTLIQTRSGDSKACRKLAEVLENQFSFTKEESTAATQTFLKAFRRCPDNSQTSLDSWRTYLWREALPTRHKHLAEQIYPKWLQLRFRYLALPPEYVQMLKRFREAQFLLALITNGPSNAQWEKIRKLNVSQYFDCVLVSSDLPFEKPNPNIFFTACNFLGVKPNECVMVGDKLETDIKGGHLAQLGATFWIPLSSGEKDLTDVAHPPDVVLRNLLDMCKYFPALNGASSSKGSSANIKTVATVNSAVSKMLPATSASLTAAPSTKIVPLSPSGSLGASATSTSSLTFSPSTSQFSRRDSQISSSSTTTSTCDHYHQQQQPQLQLQQHHHQPQQQSQQQQVAQQRYFKMQHLHSHYHQQQQQQLQNNSNMQKYRRGVSLPAMECASSETDNSSDSLFS